MRGIINALVVLLLLVVVGNLVLWSVPRVRDAANRAKCQSNFRQIGISLCNYEATYKHYPQAAMPNDELGPYARLSWLVAIEPFSEQDRCYSRLTLSKSWDSDENRYLALSDIPIYRCPSAPETVTAQ